MERAGRRWSIPLCLGVYGLLGLAAYWPVWPGDPSRLSQCACGDTVLNTWFLSSIPFAILHGHNPFLTHWLNYPAGVNLAANVQMPLLGFLATPLTLLAGPVSSLNLLMWLAFPLSAGSMYLVLRRWTTWEPAAFAGGLLYGFSPFAIGQAPAHLHLIFTPLPPVILLAAYELAFGRPDRVRRWGLVLGASSAGQYFISTEILAMTAIVVAIGAVVLAVARPGQIVAIAGKALPGIGWGLGVFVVLAAYPTWLTLAGPGHYASPANPAGENFFRADLLAPVIPTSAMRFAPHAWTALGNRFIPADTGENGSYLGIPLLVAVLSFVAFFRRNRRMLFAAVMAMATFLLSLGPRLTVDTHRTAIPLPFALLVRLSLLLRIPILDRMLPSRWALFVALFVAVVVALGVDGARRSWVGRPDAPWPWTQASGAQASTRWRIAAMVGGAMMALVTIVALIPRWPDPTVPTAVPTYFTSSSVHQVPRGGVVLTFPYPMPSSNQPMLWQATTGFRFRLVGGESLVPDRRGIGTLYPTVLRPAAIQRFFVSEAGGDPFFPSFPVADNGALVAEVRAFLRANGVGTVLVSEREQHAAVVESLLSEALGGASPRRNGGIAAWYDVQERLSRHA